METLALSHLAQQLVPLPDWEPHIDTVAQTIGKHFARIETRQQAQAYLVGLLSPVERKNGWQLAEHLGHHNPYRVQHLLDRAVWNPDAVRDALTGYVVEHLGDPDGVLIGDETGFLKKGDQSCGVARQYSGTAGRVENCQVGVFLAYASPKGAVFLDRELYLPKEWADDQKRREQTKVPKNRAFATKPQLVQQMLGRAFDAGVPTRWFTGDCVYGRDRALRAFLEQRPCAYVLAVDCDERLRWERGAIRAKTLADRLPSQAWQTLSCGAGAKGPRLYDWTCLPLDPPQQAGFGYWLLGRQSLTDQDERAYYLVFAPTDTSLATMAAVAGTRWCIEMGFESAKGEVGLDEYEVRSCHGWYRHMTLALWAHALLCVLRKNTQACLLKGGKEFPRKYPGAFQTFLQSRGLCCH